MKLDNYPYSFTLIGTQPHSCLNEESIQVHIERIKKGLKPKVITASAFEDPTLYVIDGHHKLEAYRRLNQKPTVIEIVCISARFITLEKGLSFIKSKDLKQIYRDIKKKYLFFDHSYEKRLF